MINRKAFLVVGFLLCADILLFIFSKEQELAEKFNLIVIFHFALSFLSFMLLIFFRYFSGREFNKEPFTENEKKVGLFVAFNLVPLVIALILS
ncbi:MAG: hypothetical protein FWC35_02230 [Proteobacteria bacterium]|nr:hypothetical protein [Pseudomonadota bacterium]